MNSIAFLLGPLHGTTTKGDTDDGVGRKLLDLLYARDRLIVRFAPRSSTTNVVGSDGRSAAHPPLQRPSPDDDDDDDAECGINELENEIIARLRTLNILIRRRGLFDEDESRATRFHARATERSSSSSSSTAANAIATSSAAEGGNWNETNRKRKKSGGGGGGSNNNNNNNGSTGSMSASSYGIYLDSIQITSDNSHNNNNQSRDLKEGLILTLLCKILGVHVGRKKKKVDNYHDDDDDDDGSMADRNNSSSSISGNTDRTINNTSSSSMMMTCAALNVLCSLCDHAKDGRKNNGDVATCASIEGDMMGSIGTYLLDAIVDNMHNFYSLHHHNNCGTEDATTALHGLMGCFKSCVSVITLLNVRLSRGGGGTATKTTIQTLRSTTWKVINSLMKHNGSDDDDDNNDETTNIITKVQRAAITLLATLPLTGVSSSSDGASPPTKIWSRCIVEGITLLHWAIDDFFPMMPGLDGNNNNKTRSILTNTLSADADTERLKEDHRLWVTVAKEPSSRNNNNVKNSLDLGNDNTDNHRAYSFLHRIQCLTRYIHSLLLMECHPLPNRMNSTTNHHHHIVPIDALINISEILLSFTLMAETTQCTTKTRLRSTPIIGGLISPNLALQISPKIRLVGHELMNVLMESCRGGYGMLGKARRIVSIVCTNLHSSCSTVLVSVVDGSMRRGGGSGGIGNRPMTTSSSKMGSWLRGSTPLRIKSIHTFHVMVIALGSGIMSSTATVKSISRALILLGGCLLEQIQGMMDVGINDVVASSITSNGVDDEWGTLGEKAKLV